MNRKFIIRARFEGLVRMSDEMSEVVGHIVAVARHEGTRQSAIAATQMLAQPARPDDTKTWASCRFAGWDICRDKQHADLSWSSRGLSTV